MRYKVISRCPEVTREWISLTIAGFAHAAQAIAFCQGLNFRADVVDGFLGVVLCEHRNPRALQSDYLFSNSCV